jgi:hypothetical protein
MFIHSNIIRANRLYLGHAKVFQSKLLSRNGKKFFINPTLTYWSKTWTVAMEEINALRILGKNIMGKIYITVKEGELCRLETNKKTNDILQSKDIVKFMKSLELIRYDQVERIQTKKCHSKL